MKGTEGNGLMKHLRIAFASLLVGGGLLLSPAAAQDCGGERHHVTSQADDLYTLAERYYGDRDKWSAILNANLRVLGGNPYHVPRGLRLRIPCLEETSVDSAGGRVPPPPPEQTQVELRLLTGGDYAPFTDQALPNGGLITEIVDAALSNAPRPVSFGLFWEDSWSKHFELLKEGIYHIGFPWFRPDCETYPERERCRLFHFSEPIFEMLVMLFVHSDAPLNYRSDEDIESRNLTICRPDGYFTHDLDRGDRRWLERQVITLVTPDTPKDCFDMLARQEVDAVSLNEFTGREVVHESGYGNCIKMEPQPMSIEGLHAITYKGHWRATAHRYRFDGGVQKLRERAEYNEIVDRHMADFWEKLESAPGPDNCPGGAAASGGGASLPPSFGQSGGDHIDSSPAAVREQLNKVFFVYANNRFLAPNAKLDSAGRRIVSEIGLTASSTHGNGSGFLIAPDLVLTNSHVVAGAEEVIVANKAFGVMRAEVLDWTQRFEVGDPDFALLRLPRPLDIEPAAFSPFADELDEVVAMGYPGKLQGTDRDTLLFKRDLSAGRQPSAFPNVVVTKGAVQMRRRNGQGVEELIHGSEISPGNSGGPLFDACGRVVGINTLVIGLDGSSQVQYEAALSAVEIFDYLKGQNVDFAGEGTKCGS